MVAAGPAGRERRIVARAGQEIRLVTSAATGPGDFSDTLSESAAFYFRLYAYHKSVGANIKPRTIVAEAAIPARHLRINARQEFAFGRHDMNTAGAHRPKVAGRIGFHTIGQAAISRDHASHIRDYARRAKGSIGLYWKH